MAYLDSLLLILQGVGGLLIMGALFAPTGSTEAKEFAFGPIRVAVRRPNMFVLGLLLLGLGGLFWGIGNLLSLALRS